jgi:hypothetical protein
MRLVWGEPGFWIRLAGVPLRPRWICLMNSDMHMEAVPSRVPSSRALHCFIFVH